MNLLLHAIFKFCTTKRLFKDRNSFQSKCQQCKQRRQCAVQQNSPMWSLKPVQKETAELVYLIWTIEICNFRYRDLILIKSVRIKLQATEGFDQSYHLKDILWTLLCSLFESLWQSQYDVTYELVRHNTSFGWYCKNYAIYCEYCMRSWSVLQLQNGKLL